jgi:dihydroorotase
MTAGWRNVAGRAAVFSPLYGRAIIMPNIKPPIRTLKDAAGYRQKILNCLPPGHGF